MLQGQGADYSPAHPPKDSHTITIDLLSGSAHGMTTASKNPTDLARKTIRQLATRRIPPTPDHYQEIYVELAAKISRAAALPGLARALVEAVARKDWAHFNKALTRQLSDLVAMRQLPWHTLIRELVRQWENGASRPTITQKRDGEASPLIPMEPTGESDRATSTADLNAEVLALRHQLKGFSFHRKLREGLIQRADAAMYQAKQSGKNQVALANLELEANDAP